MIVCPECSQAATRNGQVMFQRPDDKGELQDGEPVTLYQCKPCELEFAIVSHNKPIV